jgi:aryl sulfotransferase
MHGRPRIEHVYQNTFMDSGRWADYVPRDGDIIICTAYKAGTTWTQNLCALLIFQTPRFPLPLAEISPWFDMRPYELDAMLARYAAQTHRRFIKTHTPLDGLPYHDNVTYLVCGRDPRDIFISMQHHKENQNVARIVELLTERGETVPAPTALPGDLNERFRLWLTRGSFAWEQDGFPFWSVFHHAQTYWQHRRLPNLQFLHYADLTADLGGEMRRLARLLDIEVDEGKWPELVQAATFAEMKRNADRLAPDTDLGLWRDNAQFFHSGRLGQWRELLSPSNLALYEQISGERLDPKLKRWLESGARSGRDPKAE